MADNKSVITTKDALGIVGSYEYNTTVVTTITGSMSTQTALEENLDREFLSLYNNSSFNAFIKWGDGASSNDFSLKMAASSYYESVLPVYRGKITVVWAGVNGTLQVTEGF